MNDNLPIIYLTDNDFELINNGLSIKTVDGIVSLELIRKILYDDNYYAKIYNFFLSNKNKFGFIYKKNDKTEKIISLKKIDIVEAMRNYINEHKDTDESEIIKYKKLESMISLPGLKKDYRNYIYNISIDNIDYHIPAIQMIELLEMNDFVKIINNSKTINNIKKEHFLYAIERFIIDEKIHRNYKMPNIVRSNYSYILNDVDLEAVNRFLDTIDITPKLIKVDKDLEKEILGSIPPDLNNTEKSIYIYIKMCKLLSYDEEIYAYNQKGEVLKKHQDYHYISKINLNNREVVCFEFNVLYCYFLSKLGLNYKSNYLISQEESYGMGHVSVEYRTDKYLINADSTVNIIYSDLYYAKFNKKLGGIKCLNSNKKTQSEFNNMLNKVYERIYDKENQFEDMANNDISSKLKYLFDSFQKLPKDNLNTMDCVSYFIDLYRSIFDSDERKNKVKVTFVRCGSKINIIVTINSFGVEYIEDNNYYIVIPNGNISSITHEELQDVFDDGRYEYVNDKRDKIPGIKLDNIEDVKRI